MVAYVRRSEIAYLDNEISVYVLNTSPIHLGV